jgi:hypothetical protein
MDKYVRVYVALGCDGFVLHTAVYMGTQDRELQFQDDVERHTGKSIMELRHSKRLSHMTSRVVEVQE